jgi:hypothetical protein
MPEFGGGIAERAKLEPGPQVGPRHAADMPELARPSR